MGFSGDAYLRLRQLNTNVSAKGIVATGDGGPVTVATAKTGWTIFVQRVHIHINTSAAKTATFEDATPTVIVGVTDSAPSADAEYHWDFGPEGIGLTEAKNLIIALSGAGLAFSWNVEAFMKQTGTERVNSGIGVGTGTGQQFS